MEQYTFIVAISLCILIGCLGYWMTICQHKWKVVQTIKVSETDTGCRYTRYHLQCEKCGNVKVKDMQ